MGEIGVNDYNYAFLAGKHINEIELLVPLVIDSIISAVKVRSLSKHTLYALNNVLKFVCTKIFVPTIDEFCN